MDLFREDNNETENLENNIYLKHTIDVKDYICYRLTLYLMLI